MFLIEGGSLSDVLRDAIVTIFDPKKCDENYSRLPEYEGLWPRGITGEYILCAGGPDGGIDACQGDSGGPLMKKLNGKVTLVGVVAKGFGCGLRDFPGIYVLIKSYLDWIENIVFTPVS